MGDTRNVPEDLRLLIRLGARARAPAVVGILAMAVVGAVLEVVGVGLVFPLIALLHEPERIAESEALARAYEAIGADSTREFLIALSLVMAAVFLIKTAYMVVLAWAETRFLARWRADTSQQLMRAYLCAPFASTANRNSAGPVRTVASLVPKVFEGFVRSNLSLAVNAIMALAIVAVIGFAEPVVVGVSLLALPMLVLQHQGFRRRSLRLGKGLTRLQRERQKGLQESFGALKEAKVVGREGFLLGRFQRVEEAFTENHRKQAFLQQLPPLITEIVLMASILALVIAILFSDSRSGDTLASLGLLAAASFRLAPLCNRLLISANSVHHGRDAARTVLADLETPLEVRPESTASMGRPERIERELRLEGVCFRYPGAERDALHDISFALAAGERVGLAGPSGAGKTTLADLVLGVFEPTRGSIRVDGRPIRGRSLEWRRAVGYVAQSVYLLDDSVRCNVAFGLDPDDERVWAALELAQVADAVRDLPGGLDANLGENGARLSAGQRQRIGIARALYPDPSLLVLDEATSALDAATESDFAAAIRDLGGEKSLLVIAHRRATLEVCDRVVFLREGRIEAIGADKDLPLAEAGLR